MTSAVHFLPLFAACTLAVLATGCYSMKRGGTKSEGKLYETFFVGEEGMQYFIKPFFVGNKSDAAVLDITFRYKSEVKDSATVNVSFLGNEPFKTADSIAIASTTGRVRLDVQKHMFSEKAKKGYTSRFATRAPLAQIKNTFNDGNWTVTLYRDGAVRTYTGGNKTRKTVVKLRDNVFAVL
jgi:hypothetical protein